MRTTRSGRTAGRRLLSLLLTLTLCLSLLPAVSLPAAAVTAGTGDSSGDAFDALGLDTTTAPEGYDPYSSENPYGRDTLVINPVYELITTRFQVYEEDDITTPDADINALRGISLIYSNVVNTTGAYNSADWGNFRQSGNHSGHWLTEDLRPVDNGNTTVPYTDSAFMAAINVAGNFNGTGREDSFATVAVRGHTDTDENGNTKYDSYGSYEINGSKYYGNELVMLVGGRVLEGNQPYVIYPGREKELLTFDSSRGETFGNTTGVDYVGSDTNPVTGPNTEKNDPDKPRQGDNLTDREQRHRIMNYLAACAGDFDGDGRDELAVYVAERNKPRVDVYKFTGTSISKPNDWTLQYSYALTGNNGLVPNMVDLLAEDLDRDGTDDLCIAWNVEGYDYNTEPSAVNEPKFVDGSTAGRLQVLYGSKDGRMLLDGVELDVSYSGQDLSRLAMDWYDINGDGQEELIVAGHLADELRGDGEYGINESRIIYFYQWGDDENARNYSMLYSNKLDIVDRDSEGNVKDNYKFPDSTADMKINLAAVNLRGPGSGCFLYIDSILFQWGDNGLSRVARLDDSFTTESEAAAAMEVDERYVEYGAVAGDFNGTGTESLSTMQYDWETGRLFEVRIYLENTEDGDKITSHRSGELEMKRGGVPDFTYAQVRADIDDDSVILKYTGNHHLIYSDPEVMAVLASAPYFADLVDGDYPGDEETAYTVTSGTTSQRSSSNGFSVGAFFGFEKSLPFVGGALFEAETTSSFTWSAEHSSTVEYEVSYGTNAGQDVVVFYSIPIEVFEYEYYVPDTDTWETMTVNIPYEPCESTLPLDTYQQIQANYEELPDLSGVLTSTPGDPASYPGSAAELAGASNIRVWNGEWARTNYGADNGVGYGQISQSIAMSEEEGNTFEYDLEVTTKMGKTFGGGAFQGGVILGYGHGETWGTVNSSGYSYSGNVTDLPVAAEPYGYAFSWKICGYTHTTDSGHTFPVVTFLTTDVTAPPALPTDFSQDYDATTDDAVGLTWSYSGTAAGFQLYRYYDFPEGSGSYELGPFIPASEYDSADSSTGGHATRYYSYVDSGLEPYTEYDYQIQVIGASYPTDSILSEPMTARTKSSEGYPDISLNTESLMLWPDKDSLGVTLNIHNLSDYEQTPKFQWQKQDGANWVDVGGATGTSLVFSAPGMEDVGVYRCRVNAIYDGNRYLTAYSNPVTVNYDKRTAELGDIQVTQAGTASGGQRQVTLELAATNPHSDSAAIPGGQVTFTVEGTGYSKSATVQLDEYGTATVTLTLPDNGAYTTEAYYAGSRIFKDASSAEFAFATGDGGYIIDMPAVVYFGDAVAPVLKHVDEDNNITTVEDASIRYNWSGGSDCQIFPAFGGAIYELTTSAGDVDVVNYIGTATVSATYDGQTASTTVRSNPRPLVVGVSGISDLPTFTADIYDDHVADGGETVWGMELLNGTTPSAAAIYGHDTVDELFNLGLYSNSGQSITSSGTLPGGLYTLSPVWMGSPYTDGWGTPYFDVSPFYSVTIVPKDVTVTATTYNLTYSAKEFTSLDGSGITAGTISKSYPTDERTAYAAGTTLVFSATPYNGFRVKEWYLNGAAQDTSSSSFSTVTTTSATKVEVEFERKDLTIEFKVPDPASGTIVCSSHPMLSSGTEVQYGATFTFTAQPKEGYHFVEWQYVVLGQKVSYPEGVVNDDGSRSLTITMGGDSVVLNAVFARDSYTLTLDEHLRGQYYADTDNNSTTPDELVTVSSGASIPGDTEVTVIAAPGYVLADEPAWTVDGTVLETPPATPGKYTFIIKADTTVTARTEQQTFNVTVGAADHGAVTVRDGGGAEVTELTGLAGGSKLTFAAVPDRGYTFDGWSITGETENRTENPLTIDELGGDMEITPSFAEITEKSIYTVSSGPRGAVYYAIDGLDGGEEKLAAADGEKITLYKGETLTLRAQPDTNYMVYTWTEDNSINQTTQTTKTYTDVTEDHNIALAFVVMFRYTVTLGTDTVNSDDSPASASGGTLSATADGVNVTGGRHAAGSKMVFTATPNSGYYVSQWLVNDQPVTQEGEASQASALLRTTPAANYYTGSTYVVDALAENMNVKVVFKASSETTYSITKDAISNGDVTWTVQPARADGKAAEGDQVTVTATPAQNYDLVQVTASWANSDNEPIVIENGVFTMPAGDVTITATFKEHVHAAEPDDWQSDDANHWQVCVCGERLYQAAHTPGDWIVDQAATATTSGSRHKECTVCRRTTETETIPATGSSGGGGGGGGAGGGGGGSTAPDTGTTITVPISGEDNTVWVEVTLLGTTATIESIDLGGLETVIGDHVNTGTVTIDFSGLDVQVDTVAIPTDAIQQIAQAVSDPANDAESLGIALSDGTSIAFDAAALGEKAVQAGGGEISISIRASVGAGAQVSVVGGRPAYDVNVTSGGHHITDMGGNITIKAPYELRPGERAHGLVVWYVDDDGNRERCVTRYDSAARQIIWETNHLSLYMIGYDEEQAAACPQDDTCPLAEFTDVDMAAWYHDGIHYCVENGLMGGTSATTFEPDTTTSRAMIAVILWRLEGSPVVEEYTDFSDVADGAWYTQAIRWASSVGVVGGYPGGSFGPNDPITREQLAVMLYRYAQYQGVETSTMEENLAGFTDANKISGYAVQPMNWAVGQGIMGGYGDGILDPQGNASRAQGATMLQRFCEAYENSRE